MGVDEYRQCVEIASGVDYADKDSVRRMNQAVDTMYRIVSDAVQDGETSIRKLITLLDEPEASKWLAHQLVASANLAGDVEDRCFAIIEDLARGDGPDAIGEQMWLDEWRSKKGRI